jgi:hypothetical protein
MKDLNKYKNAHDDSSDVFLALTVYCANYVSRNNALLDLAFADFMGAMNVCYDVEEIK